MFHNFKSTAAEVVEFINPVLTHIKYPPPPTLAEAEGRVMTSGTGTTVRLNARPASYYSRCVTPTGQT